MSELKDNITKQVERINNAISDDKERAEVMNAIQELIREFAIHMVRLTERQNELDEKITNIYDILTDIESTISDNEDMYDFCPYCGEEIFVAPKENSNEFECPHCHNIIEIEEE